MYLNETINQINNFASSEQTKNFITQLAEGLSSIPKWLSDNLTIIFQDFGLQVSSRWVGLLVLFLSGCLLLLGIKLSKSILKWILIIVGVLLILGILIPTW